MRMPTSTKNMHPQHKKSPQLSKSNFKIQKKNLSPPQSQISSKMTSLSPSKFKKKPHKYDFKIELPVKPTFTILPESFKPDLTIEGEIGKFSRLKQQVELDTIDRL